MRVIKKKTLKRLIRLYEEIEIDWKQREGFEKIINDIKETDTLTVSKLRPMCEAPINSEKFIALIKSNRNFIIISSFGNSGKYWTDGCCNDLMINDEFIGWLPLPIYKPELIE